jgi:hypothetical protein
MMCAGDDAVGQEKEDLSVDFLYKGTRIGMNVSERKTAVCFQDGF